MNRKNLYALAAIALAFALLAVGYMLPARDASATTVASGTYDQKPVVASLFAATSLTSAVQYGPIADVTNFDSSELQYVFAPSNVNTTTITLQWSNNKVNWSESSIAAAVTTTVAAFATPSVTGRYWRVKVAPTNSLTTTVGVTAILK